MTTSKQLLPISLLLAMLLALFPSKPGYAAVNGTCTVGDPAYLTIQAAVNDTACTTIHVPAGTYTENVVINNIDRDPDLSIQGDGAGTTTVNGGGLNSVFLINNSTVSLSGLTITGGNASGGNGGGGINNKSGNVTVSDSTISGNTASGGVSFGGFGGGIWNKTGNMTVNDSTISGNTAIASGSEGGGIINTNGGSLTVNNSTFSGNSASGGGGISNAGGSVTVSKSTFNGNSGAGIWNSSGDVTVSNSTFSGNSGGIINSSAGSMTVNNSIFSGNSPNVNGNGGGINNGGSMTVSNSTFSGNRGGSNGGGIDNTGGTMTVSNSTFSDNTASEGGGINNNTRGSMTVSYSTFSGNTASFGGAGIANSASMTVSNSIFANSLLGGDCKIGGTLVNGGYNLVEDGSCFNGLTDLRGDPKLGLLVNKGGPTLIHALVTGSLAIDAIPFGINGCGDPLTSDQRGLPRPSPTAGSCDIGAYELGETPHDADNDGKIDTADNCPSAANNDQADSDVNGVGDACTGPVVTSVSADPNPLAVNTTFQMLQVYATVDDTTTGNSKIKTAEFQVDGGAYTRMDPVDGSFNSATESVNSMHPAFTTTGLHSLCVRGTDVEFQMGEPQCILIAVYDPSAGYVSGAGWINSPSSAYTPGVTTDVDYTGRANFAFVAKYQKKETQLSGETQFQFQAGDLNFQSLTYEWLLVAGSTAKYKGVGTINGAGSYGFMLTATDGHASKPYGIDTFRIKIWDKNNRDAIVYDNQPIESDNSNLGTELGSGRIIVHSGKESGPGKASVSTEEGEQRASFFLPYIEN